MNWQDISDFIELVKNPNKYDKYLSELKDARDQLTAASELVGKANEIEVLQKKATKLVEKAEVTAAKLEAESVASALKRQEVLDKMFADLDQRAQEVTKVKQDADGKLAQAQELVKDYNEQVRKLRADQKAYDLAANDLAAKTTEVDEKLAKIRSLMGE